MTKTLRYDAVVVRNGMQALMRDIENALALIERQRRRIEELESYLGVQPVDLERDMIERNQQ